jgi:hypothetical protein
MEVLRGYPRLYIGLKAKGSVCSSKNKWVEFDFIRVFRGYNGSSVDRESIADHGCVSGITNSDSATLVKRKQNLCEPPSVHYLSIFVTSNYARGKNIPTHYLGKAYSVNTRTVRNQNRDTFLRQKQRHAFAPQLNPIGTQLLPCRITPLKSSTINYYIGIIVYTLPGLPESSLWTKGKRHRLQSSREPSPPRMPDHHCQPSDIHYGNAT